MENVKKSVSTLDKGGHNVLNLRKIMKNYKEVKVSYLSRHLTVIISVTLVLLLLGVIAMVWAGADRETRRLKEKIELCVVLRDSIPSGASQRLAENISRQPYCANVNLISKEDALKKWTEDTGENLEELFGVNPLSEEINFGLKSEYANASAIKSIKSVLEKEQIVESVSVPDSEMVEAMNRNIQRLSMVLALVAGIMLVISFVLINNTVHLTIYSRRFTIHTMKLVGATNGFIRRPVIVNNMFAGMTAGLLASGILSIFMVSAPGLGLPNIADMVGWEVFGMIAAALVLAGMTLCSLASWASANTYLRKDYDSLFK